MNPHATPQRPLCVVRLALFLVCALVSSTHGLQAQRPCNDTIVRAYDTICEGDSITYFGRVLSHQGLYFDTIPRTDTLCDSVIILKLSVLTIPGHSIFARKHCTPIIAYDLLGGYPQINYYHWSAEPPDSTLNGQEDQSWVRVNPRQPTTYTLLLDYREDPPQCPATCSITVNPIEPVAAAMRVIPDEITYDNMHIILEDFSTGTRENRWGGWAGRNWYINGVRQQPNDEWVEFYGDPSWGDTVHIMMEAYSPSCLDTATRDIPFRRVSLYIPNVFTPDAETNNIIIPHTIGITDLEIWIYDRRGVLIFHSDQPEKGWDGKDKHGQPCHAGTYTYFCRYRDTITPSGYQSTKGSITLLR